ncbi:MAG TPA: hypothetical protein PKH77_25455 [Anaerolineae bacterium]|nr:hypothetical protein [Anaerolineae bacterium]
MSDDLEANVCIPELIRADGFNSACGLPYGLAYAHVQKAMESFVDFLGFLNQQLHSKGLPRLENFLMPANFSSIVGEFMNLSIPQYCLGLVKNRYHNGHPDLIPVGMFPNDRVQYTSEGIEVKGSRHNGGWQGHNPEAVWLMVFHFDSNTPNDGHKKIGPKPFRFIAVYAALLIKEDWNFSGRSATSRRTITASVNQQGVEKMRANWVYRSKQ